MNSTKRRPRSAVTNLSFRTIDVVMEIATVDDGLNGRDPLMKATLPQDGAYVLVLIDANDRGGVTHPYLLELRGE
jgi:hypothetical protein